MGETSLLDIWTPTTSSGDQRRPMAHRGRAAARQRREAANSLWLPAFLANIDQLVDFTNNGAERHAAAIERRRWPRRQ